MRKVVRDIFWDHNVPMEGFCTWMYPDVKGLISTGVGNLIDPIQYALVLPWRNAVNDKLATQAEISDTWKRLKAMGMKDGKPTKESQFGGGWWKQQSNLRLRETDIRKLVDSKLTQMVTDIKGKLKDWNSYPADGQLGILSMSWAMGQHFFPKFPMFTAYLKARDWEGCAKECTMTEKGNPGVIPRNANNRILFRNAAQVEKLGLDPDKLYFPAELGKPCPTCGKP